MSWRGAPAAVLACLLWASAEVVPSVARQLKSGAPGAPVPPLPTYEHVAVGYAAHPDLGNLAAISSWRDVYVDPAAGSDANSGAAGSPLASIAAAWRLVPSGVRSQAWRINVAAGAVTAPIYMELKQGSAAAPVLIRGAGPSTIATAFNVFQVSYLYLANMTVQAGGGDVLHFEACSFIWLSRLNVVGSPAVDEDIKVNQVAGLYIEDCDIAVARVNTVDCVAVQYGHIVRNRMRSASWCNYFKGGSSYLIIDSNEVWDCNEAAMSMGQGTGFQFMEPPWLNYEVYDIKVTNNVIRSVWGAGLSVFGGYNVLLAYNTLFSIGTHSHMVEVAYGGRTCDVDPNTGSEARCASNRAAGGWGPPSAASNPSNIDIPAANVFLLNNLVVNPAGVSSQWSHFSIWGSMPGAITPPGPIAVDTNLVIAGNLLWNGPERADMGLGLGGSDAIDSSGCQASNPTCNVDLVRALNRINNATAGSVAALNNPGGGDFRLRADALRALAGVALQPLPSFPAWSVPSISPSSAPQGTLANSVPHDKAGAPRRADDPPGAFGAASSVGPDTPPPSASPSPPPASPRPSPSPSPRTPSPSPAAPSPSPRPGTSPAEPAPPGVVVTDIQLRLGNRPCPSVAEGWSRVDGDLNTGASGGRAVRLCVQRAQPAPGEGYVAADVYVHAQVGAAANVYCEQDGYDTVPHDLNARARPRGASRHPTLKLCIRKVEVGSGTPALRGLAVVQGTPACPASYHVLDAVDRPGEPQDLNWGARLLPDGGAIYLCLLTD